MASEVVHYEVSDGVALITLDRPEGNNAWNGELGGQYFAALQRAADDLEARVIVVTGAGRMFCPGADMGRLTEISGGASSAATVGSDLPPFTYPLTVPKPIIAAINGGCAGIGLSLALMTDIRFAASEAKITTAFARRGCVAEQGSSWILPRIVGFANAMELMLSARILTADEALALGLVNRVVPREELLETTLAYARDLAANCSPASMAKMKQQFHRHALTSMDVALAESSAWMEQQFRGADFREGVAAFVEGRPPSFEPLGKGTVFEDDGVIV